MLVGHWIAWGEVAKPGEWRKGRVYMIRQSTIGDGISVWVQSEDYVGPVMPGEIRGPAR